MGDFHGGKQFRSTSRYCLNGNVIAARPFAFRNTAVHPRNSSSLRCPDEKNFSQVSTKLESEPAKVRLSNLALPVSSAVRTRQRQESHPLFHTRDQSVSSLLEPSPSNSSSGPG
ncbi:hypothetical protein GOBAR_DD05313 [Gossypium barbadense]|nr:hypothetical protein GOBAR_DD05313 [Gossypium barbadense]